MKKPTEILKEFERRGETVKTIALGTGLTEREVLLAVKGEADYNTKFKIAYLLDVSIADLFGKQKSQEK